MKSNFKKLRILSFRDVKNTGISESLQPQLMHWHKMGHEIWEAAVGIDGWVASLPIEKFPWRERILGVRAFSSRGRFGSECISEILRLAKPDVVISAYDVWMIEYLSKPEMYPEVSSVEDAIGLVGRDTRSFNHIAYFPLDGLVQNLHLPKGMDETIMGFDFPVTYSEFSRDAILRDTGLYVPFIPICHDPKIYKPIPKKEAKRAIRQKEDSFIIGMVATNQYRKLWSEFIVAAAEMARRHEDVIIIPWTSWGVQIAGGFDIHDLLYRESINQHQVVDPGPQYGLLKDKDMANLYSAMDICVLTTVGEGAGLPPIRARACGTPALVSDNTSNTEFSGHPFELIPSYPSHLDNGSNIQRFTSDVGILISKMEELYQNKYLRDEIAEAGINHVRKYEIDTIMPMWDALLNIAGGAKGEER